MERPKESPGKVQDLLQELVRICKNDSPAAAIFDDRLTTESGEYLPSLKKASTQTVPKMQLLHEQRVLLAASPYPQKLMEKIEQLKDLGVPGIDRYIWLVGQILADPDVKKLVSVQPGTSLEASGSPDSSPSTNATSPSPRRTVLEQPSQSVPISDTTTRRASRDGQFGSLPESTVKKLHSSTLDESNQSPPVKQSPRATRVLEVPKPLIEGISYPATPRWNLDRPFLTGKHMQLSDATTPQKSASRRISMERESASNGDANRSLGIYSPSVQELLLLDDLLFMMVGIEGNYVRVRRGRLKDNFVTLYMDPTMDSSLQELARRILPLCENYMIVSQFAESRSHFKHGLVNHALAAALRAILQDYHAMIAQLEHQFRLTRLSLQGLWFFCQPMMGALQALSAVVQKAVTRNLSGAAILNLLHNQATAMAGDSAARALLQKLTQAASTPYFGILERWVCEGVIDDPYGEFLIDENKALQKESLSHDYNATYWQQRYSLRHDVPGFLSNSAEAILTTGKYLNAARECGYSIKVPFSDDIKSNDTGLKRPYLEQINVAYNLASAELVKLINDKFDLMGRLRSMKHYFLMDQGDFLVHFMDIAKDELLKRPSAISMEKLQVIFLYCSSCVIQSLLELALRTSVAASDPYHDDLSCNVEKSSLITQLQNASSTGIATSVSALNLEPAMKYLNLTGQDCSNEGAGGSITGLETFTLDYKVPWPLSLVISKKALTKYQLIFRHLFHCKHVERQLCMTWQVHQATRGLNFTGTALSRSYVLCQRMLHFLQSFEHYMTFEVLEPNWHAMVNLLQSATSIDEVMLRHDKFLDKCLKECMLLWPNILKRVELLKSICLQYATATQWLIPSLSTSDNIHLGGGDMKDRVFRTGKPKQRTRFQQALEWKAEDDSNFKSILRKTDEEFKNELSNLISMLSHYSQAEPCFAHLAQVLQGDDEQVS